MTAKVTAGLLLVAGVVLGQTASSRLAFEVASVKPIDLVSMKSGGGTFRLSVGTKIEGNKVDINMASLSELVTQAFRLKSYQLTGPDWMKSERYEIHAKMPEGTTKEQVPEMLQSLLADRFKLTFHKESKDHQVYALSVGKNGLKLTEVEPDPPGTPPAPATGGGGNTIVTNGVSVGGGGGQGRVMTFSNDGSGKAVASGSGSMHIDRKMTMQSLCDLLSRFMDRPVVDVTELTKTYQVAFDIPMDSLMAMAKSSGNMVVVGNPSAGSEGASDPTDESAMFRAVQGLGLKLDQRKAPMDFIVVEHAEKVPTEN